MSKIKADALSTLAGAEVPMATVVSGSAKAWVNFNGTGTVAIRAAFNVTSITDNDVGDYTVNFTTAMPDANYAASVSGSASEANHAYLSLHRSVPAAAGSLRVRASNGANAATDLYQATVAIFR